MASKKQELVVEVTTKADQAKRDFAELDKKAKDLEGKPIEVPVKVDADQAKAQLETTGRAAAGAKNAFANLVGNTAQDLGNLGGPLGAAGVALGQVAEYTADAANEGGGLTAALKGATGMAGPLAALSLAGLAVSNVMGRMSKQAQEAKEATENMTKGFVESTGVLDDWSAALDEGFSQGTLDRVESLTRIIQKGLGEEAFQRTGAALGALGKNLNDLGPDLVAADQNFRQWALGAAKAAGYSDDAAKVIVDNVDDWEHMSQIMAGLELDKAFQGLDPAAAEKLRNVAGSLEEVNDQVEKGNIEKSAKDFLNLARAVPEYADAVKEAADAGGTEVEQALRVNDAIQEQARVRDENARATEEGARLAQESGTIIDQVGRQVATAADMAREAQEKAKKAQDDWLLGIQGAQGEVDDVTGALAKYQDVVTKNAEAVAKGDQTQKDKILSDIAERDAMAAIVREGLDVVRSYEDQGLTADQARQKQADLAQQQYDLAIAMGYPEEAAKKIKDQILAIPPSVTSEVDITQRGYYERLAELEALERDIHNTVYFAGVVDRSLQDAINKINWNAPPGTVVTPSAAVAPQTGGLAVVPMAMPTAGAAPSGAATINVNLSGGIVADTFQLQRVVERAVRSGTRLGGRR